MLTTLMESGQGFTHRYRSAEFIVIVVRLPTLFRSYVKFDRCIVNYRGSRHSLVQGGGIDDRLECGSGIPAGLHRAVELAATEIVSSNHGFYGTAFRVESYQGCLGKGFLVQCKNCSPLVIVRGDHGHFENRSQGNSLLLFFLVRSIVVQ